MSFDVASLQTLASNLLTEFGQSVTFERATSKGFDPTTGRVVGESSTTYIAVGQPVSYNANEVDNETILQSDIKFICYTTTEPQVGDTCTLVTTPYRVNFIEYKKVQGSNIVYRLQLRA